LTRVGVNSEALSSPNVRGSGVEGMV